jgi:carbonic anhydrase
MNQNNIRTITFELSSPEIQHHEITHNDKLIMVKFRKSANAIFASEETLQIHIYGSYFKTGHTIKIQCIPYEVGEMSLEEYTNAKFTLHSPNNELSMETISPYSDAAILSQRNILHITFYDGHWIKTYSV